MAYTLDPSPLPFVVSTTSVAPVELTVWEEIKIFFSEGRNVALYIVLPGVGSIYLLFVFMYIIHKLRRYMKMNRRRRRAERKAADADRQPMMSSTDDVDSGSSSPCVKRVTGPVFLTYHDNSAAPSDDDLYPSKDITTLHPPKPQVAQHGPVKKMTTITAKPKTQIIVRCRCTGRVHTPGCPQFSLPAVKPASPMKTDYQLNASTSEVNVSLKDAMEKVAVYERELKTNPSTQALLYKYRMMKKLKERKKWNENAEKGNWQQVPIAQLLEIKKKMKDGNASSLSSVTNPKEF